MKYRKYKRNIKYLLYEHNIFDNSNLKSKYKFSKIDFILAFIDININPNKYEYQKITKTVRFWGCVKRNKNLCKFFGFKPSTLKRYWYSIRKSRNVCKFVEILQAYYNILNIANIHILTIIKIINEFIIKRVKQDFLLFFDSKKKLGLFKSATKTKNKKKSKDRLKAYFDDIDYDSDISIVDTDQIKRDLSTKKYKTYVQLN